MKYLCIDGPACGEQGEINAPGISVVVVHRAGGSGPGGHHNYQYKPTVLTPEVAKLGSTMALTYVGIDAR